MVAVATVGMVGNANDKATRDVRRDVPIFLEYNVKVLRITKLRYKQNIAQRDGASITNFQQKIMCVLRIMTVS